MSPGRNRAFRPAAPGVGFLLALAEALGELSAGPLTAFHEQPVRVSPGLDTRDVEVATGALIGV